MIRSALLLLLLFVSALSMPGVANAGLCASTTIDENACDTDAADGSTADDICTVSSTAITCDLDKLGSSAGATLTGRLVSSTWEFINGNGGNDTLFGDGGNDIITCGAGNDDAKGGPGDDVIDGNDGNDRIAGENDMDALYGDAGSDLLCGGAELGFADYDYLDGGADNDVLWGLIQMTSGSPGASDGIYNQGTGGQGSDQCDQHSTLGYTGCEAWISVSATSKAWCP